MTLRSVHYRFDEENCLWCGNICSVDARCRYRTFLARRVPLFAALLIVLLCIIISPTLDRAMTQRTAIV